MTIEELAGQDGVHYAFARGKDGPREFAGDAQWDEIAGRILALQEETDEPEVRMALNCETLVAKARGPVVVGVCYHRHHPVNKSILRLLDRVMKARAN